MRWLYGEFAEYLPIVRYQSIAHAEWWATDGPSRDQNDQKEGEWNSDKDRDALFRAEPPTVGFLDFLHCQGVFLELRGQLGHLLRACK